MDGKVGMCGIGDMRAEKPCTDRQTDRQTDNTRYPSQHARRQLLTAGGVQIGLVPEALRTRGGEN